MVKNAKGGNKSKKMGRKFLGAPVQKQVRLADPNEPCEIYGVVERLLGRGKRDNTVVLGGFVLVGIREYESAETAKCDLLEVYTEAEKQKLKKSGNPIFAQLKTDHDREPANESGIEFTAEDPNEEKYEELITNTNTTTNTTTIRFDEGEEIDINDI
jgi:hypothetical protein